MTVHAYVRCVKCGSVYDSCWVTVTARYVDCSMWKCPGCGILADDRPIGWGGNVEKLTNQEAEAYKFGQPYVMTSYQGEMYLRGAAGGFIDLEARKRLESSGA